MTLPSFDDLPLKRPGPPYNAWGLFGDDDELGRLNLITPESVKRGRDEIKEGIVINLNMPLSLTTLHPARPELKHTINHRNNCNDDFVNLNTQTSTQWDGFRHYPYQNYPEKGQYVYYNGQTSEEAKDPNVHRNGIQNFVKHPITSRAHLLDIARYLKLHNRPPLESFASTTPIPVSDLDACAKEEGVEFLPGDILVLRTGHTENAEKLTAEDREELAKRSLRETCGLDQGEDVLRWHWENGIAAVVSDNPAYETVSPKGLQLHQVFLAGWGMPIGELFDLRELAATCERLGRWSFLFTSMPLYVNAGIASPPNAQAII
ncbi:hypothetical protein M231_07642 [Tremella mesenterica]|uniref:Cyclase n=1 Tax=Tremella mesenterica TaxID=5217 RepID=A0A4V1M2Z5_TREME|nr:uncharacterized protein TREMEDRAFT_26184 [Tremella mesenterica DSM 1558]EIW72047.1 hypothetical protein TREMEDRAFT_26184 [Tremella mesenterica DSM 1558]RXK35090.1 hypothetical protein M231_07642 [Tremella mesenterica]